MYLSHIQFQIIKQDDTVYCRIITFVLREIETFIFKEYDYEQFIYTIFLKNVA